MSQFQSVQEVTAALRRRALLILAVIVLGCVASLWVALQQVKVYEATAVVQIEDARVSDPMTGTATPGSGDAARRVQLIEQRLMARDNLLNIMDEYRLFPREPSVNERIGALREAVIIEEIRGGAPAWQTGVAPSGLRITVRLPDPQAAADIANRLMTSVIEQARDRSETRTRETLSFFDEEAERLAAQISEAEDAIAVFKTANTDALPSGTAALRDQLATFEEALVSLEREIIAIRNNSARLREDDLARQIGLLEDQKQLLQDRVAGIEAALARAPEVERMLGVLERDLARLQERYALVTRRQADAEMAQVLLDREAADRFEVLETALVPDVAISGSKRKVALAGGLLSVMVAFGLAVLLEMLNPAIRTPAQLERQLGITPVVSIPPIRTRYDRRRSRMIWLGVLVALGGAGYAAIRVFGAALLELDLIERLMPSRAG